MPRYKRTRDEAELDAPTEDALAPEQREILVKLRNMWEFASLYQYIHIFGSSLKIPDDFDMDDLEAECLKPTPSRTLTDFGLAFLKQVSSHRGLTPDIFDEYTRRQYQAKAPRRNPFGDDEEPAKFIEMDIYTRVRVLQQLSTWTFNNPDRMREKMKEKDPENDHLNWRVDELGWDKEGRSYYVLDDNRLYRRTDEPVAPLTPKPQVKSKPPKKSRSKATRSSKRRKAEDTDDEENDASEVDADAGAEEDVILTNGDHSSVEGAEPGYGFTSKTWECVAITLEDYQEFLSTLFRSRDRNEKQLRSQIEDQILPVIERRAEAIRQKQLKKLRELENVEKMATAKRSSRLADKAEKDRDEREKREAEEKKLRDIKMAHEEDDRQRQIEEGHESRRLTREQRLKEREVKRILLEEELAKADEASKRAPSQEADREAAEAAKRMSERQSRVKTELHKKELDKLTADEHGKWYFDCAVCGMHGENLDDGTHSVACDRCSVWQHSKCHGFSPKKVEQEGFTFVCRACKQRKADANKPKIAPLKLGKHRNSGSPEALKSAGKLPTESGPRSGGLPAHVQRQLDGVHIPHQPHPSPGPFGQITNGPSLSPYGQSHGPPGYRYPPVGNYAPHPPQQAWHGNPLPPPNRPPSSGYAGSPPPPMLNGYGPPPHYQQHQYAHHSAIASAGGHPHYQAAYSPQPNGHSPRAPNGMYPMTQPPPPSQHYYQPQAPQHHQQQQPTSRPSARPLMNGFQHANSVVPLPQQPAQRPNHPQPPHHNLPYSPNATLPLPDDPSHHRQSAHSPVKSSPPAQQVPPHPYYHNTQQTPHFTQTPQDLRPPTLTAYQPKLQTPQQPHHGAHVANGIVADGMSGPWPDASKNVPQKHDQSPAPPSSSHTVGATRIVPPTAALTPSPEQHAAAGPQNVPVKKMPGLDRAPGFSGHH